MNNLINDIKNNIYDITYLGLGTSINEKTNNNTIDYTQQFPPWLQKIYTTTNFTIRIINIDNKFENQYVLSRLDNLDKINDNEFKKDKLYIYYLNINIDEMIVDFLDKINVIIMTQKKLLLGCNYTGDELNKLENYFINLYTNTVYFDDYKNLISYDYTTTPNLSGRYLDLYNHTPIIDINQKKIIKINIEMIDNKFINDDEIKKKLKKIYVYELNKFIKEYNIYIKLKKYLKNDKISETLNVISNNICINKSIFKNIDLNNFSDIMIDTIIINKLTKYKKILVKLYQNTEYLETYITTLIDDVTEMNENEWINHFISIITCINNIKYQ